MKRSFALVSACLALLLFSGCAGYQLGPSSGAAPGEQSVQIGPFQNKTLQPRLGDALNTAIRRQVQRDGTFELATRGDADVVVTGVITRYERHELSFLPDDVLTVRDFRVTLTAQITARERSTGKVLVNQPVTGQTLVRVGSDLTSSERQALPLLAEDLAKQIVALLADGPW